MIRIRLNLGILTPVTLTYQLPEWMRAPEGPKTAPINLLSDKDVEIMSTVREYMTEPVLYVTSGPEPVAKYQFLCRSPFTIGDKTYLQEGVTEEQHREAIKDLVGGHPIHMVRDLDINQTPKTEAREWIMIRAAPHANEEESNSCGRRRKKLRLTKEQSHLLEESFTQNHTLASLKHTEMECEYLKRCFGSLKEQNRLLQKEVEEPVPASVLTICPRCERAADATDNAVKEGTAPRSQSRMTMECELKEDE
ncbi:hypothetical protein Bca101_026941 [Brassica carinata]